MKIAYIINSVEGGGAALPVPSVTRVLRNLGAEVRLFALTRRDGRALPAIMASGLNTSVREGGERDHFAALIWLDRQVAGYKPTHLWTSLTRATLLGQIVGWRRHLPVVSWQHNAYLKPTNLYLLHMMRHRSALWIADSQSVAELTEKRLSIPAARLMKWPIFAADTQAPQASPWQPGKNLHLGSLGRLHPAKGYDVLIAAFAYMNSQGFKPPVPIDLSIGGDGKQREALNNAAREAGVTLDLRGYIEQPRDYLASLHLYVQPSRSEGFCIAAHEAMQAGLPVIVTDIGEMPFTVVNGICGRVVPPANPEQLAAALVDMLADPGRLAVMGAAARHRVLDLFGEAAFRSAGAAIVNRLQG